MMPKKACGEKRFGENIWGNKLWKRPLESRKRHSESLLYEQEGAVGTGYSELCLVFGVLVSMTKQQHS